MNNVIALPKGSRGEVGLRFFGIAHNAKGQIEMVCFSYVEYYHISIAVRFF